MYITMYMTPQIHGCMVQHLACVTQFLCVQVDQRVLMMVEAIAMLMDLKDARMREKWPSHIKMQVLVLHSLVLACLSSTLSGDANNFPYLHTYSGWHAWLLTGRSSQKDAASGPCKTCLIMRHDQAWASYMMSASVCVCPYLEDHCRGPHSPNASWVIGMHPCQAAGASLHFQVLNAHVMPSCVMRARGCNRSVMGGFAMLQLKGSLSCCQVALSCLHVSWGQERCNRSVMGGVHVVQVSLLVFMFHEGKRLQ